MNFFKKLFTFLFHKDHIITKKIHSLGAVIVTTCIISLFILGVNGYASSIYASTTTEEQALVVAETESLELEELAEIEEEIDLQINVHADVEETIYAYKIINASKIAENQVEQKTLKIMESESATLSAAANKPVMVSISEADVDVTPNREPITLTANDYQVLLNIVEAEVGTEDLYSRMMIANVIINRMQHSYYPDTIEEVVFQNNGKVWQFSPILDGRYFTINVTSKTVTAVNNALAGYDNSQGALAFVNREITSDKIMEWFDNNLIFVVKYGKVEYFTF